MKKLRFINLIVFSLILTFGSCKNDNTGGSKKSLTINSYSEVKPVFKERNNLQLSTDDTNYVSFDSLKNFFKLDFTPEYPDSAFADNNQTGKKSKAKKSDKNANSESYVPGIRKLSDYATKYFTKKATLQEYAPADETEEDDSSKEFFIEDWGPQGKVVAGENHPGFYVIFSRPVQSLSALDKPQTSSDIMSIEPPLPGVFRWYGTKYLSFESDIPADPAVQYTIKINSSLKSSGGKSLTGDTVFKTQSEPVEVINLWGGYIKDSDCAYGWNTGALPPYENRFVMRTNYTTTLTAIQQGLKVYVNNTLAEYDITPIYEEIFQMWYNEADFDKEANRTNTYLVEIKSKVPHNAKVEIKNTNGDTQSYDTLRPFTIEGITSITDYSSSKYKWPLSIYFSQTPDKLSLVSNITYDNGQSITEDNISINGTSVRIFNLPFDYNQTHTISFGKNLKDKYGQPLVNAKSSYTFKTPQEVAYVKYQNYGNKMLEAQFPHKMIFEHQNLIEGRYGLQKTDRPAGDGLYDYNKNAIVFYDLDVSQKNQRQFQEMNLDPFLDNGYGFVHYESSAKYKSYNYWREEYEINNSKTSGVIQVTDLGITARMGINKSIIMVRSLSTGKPVENAEVFIVHDLNEKLYDKDILQEIFVYGNEKTYSNLIAQGRTDKDGIAVINYTGEQIQKIQKENSRAFVYVVNGNDKAAFAPWSHNSWREGVSTESLENARKPQQRTFMFTDRGIYKPGETVTFRGIDRDQLLGSFTTHTGWYSITAKGAWWDSKEIIEPIAGQLSESGGFYGSFKIPDDVKRGKYNIVYTRGDNPDETAILQFTVADFERVKFESSITVPKITYFGGDKLTANLSASYLAGGSLSGANYEVSWYKQPTTFETSDPAAKDYTFNNGLYPSRYYYSDNSGTLGTDGTAGLSCKSEQITDGAPYIYHVETAVTDISNQRIAAQNDIWVHPAQFYIGLAKAKKLRGFAKAGDKLEFPYLLVNTDGSLMQNTEVSQKVSEIEYKLTHEVWTMIHEQSVDDTIYTRYERSDVEDAAGTIKPQANSTLTLKPETSGWYTLTLTGKDNRGGKVISQIEFYVTGSGSSWFDQYNSNSLKLTPDKAQYNPGETAHVLLESPLPAGDYLVTVEREGIFTEELRHFENGAEVLDIPVAGNYVPVVYVSVSSYSERHGQPTHNYGEPDLDKPKDYYGVTPLLINPYVRSFSISIETDKPSYKPGETATIKIKATKGGKPFAGAELSALAVDRGVLDLIGYHVPNPIEFFYDREHFPLRVYGGDSRALLMDPVTYSVKNLQGGDEMLKEMDMLRKAEANGMEGEAIRKDFRATAFFEPILITDKNGEATVTFKMPDSLTTYRITAFGVKDDLFALEEEEIKVQNPINIQQVQPRRLRERDTAECGVLISNLSKDTQKVTVSLEVVSPAEDTEQDKLEGRKTIPGKGSVDGKNTHTIQVASGQSSVVYFDVAAQTEGTVNLVYTIKSDLLNEKLISPLRIEKTFVYETVAMTGTISDDQNDTEKESIIIPGFAKEGRGDLKFTLDATRLGMLGSSVNYLFDYPYGCLEQQSSRILPLVSFGDYIDIFGLNSKVQNPKACVTGWTKKWKDYQLPDGGFGYWPDSTLPSMFVSLRILYIYALAMQRGYTPDDIPIDAAKLSNYIVSEIKDYNDKAFACYVFSLIKNNSLNSIRDKLYSEVDVLTLDDAAYLSLAYFNTGKETDKQKAATINKKIRAYLQPDQRSVSISKKAKSGFRFFYQNDTVQYAAILTALVSENPDDQMVDKLLYTLLKKQSKGYWQNTVTTATVLESIYTYIKNRNLDSTDYTATVSLNGRQLMNEGLKTAAAKPKTLVLPFEDEFVSSLPRDKAIPLVFEKDGNGYLFYSVEMKYAIPDETQAARDEGIKLTYEITDFETGELINIPKDTCDVKLESGKLYKARVYIQTNRNRSYVAIRAPIPSGAEILDSTLVTTGSAAQSEYSGSWHSWLSHKNITDNEAQFFWDEIHSGRYNFDFTFRAVRRGIYPTPPVQGECMYEPEIFGRSDGYLFIIE